MKRATLTLALMLALVPLLLTRSAHAATGPTWACDPSQLAAAYKQGAWSGDQFVLGTALPEGMLAGVAADSQNRFFHLWLYDGSGHDTNFAFSFDAVTITDPGPLGMYQGRIHVTGSPSLDFHDNTLKIFYAQWPGPGGGLPSLFRVTTGCHLNFPL